MREIKFRAWTGDNLGYSYNPDLERLFALKRIANNLHEEIVFEQFTGLTDKNGKDIYEGDIVSGCGSIAKIEYRSEIAAFERITKNGPCVLSKLTNGKVIGNIHENKELIK